MPQSAGASLLPRQGLCLFEALLLLAFHSISHKPLLQLRCRVFTSCDEISLSIFAHHQIKFASPPWRCVLAMLSHLKSEALGGTLQFPLYPVHFKSLEMYFSYSLQIVAPKSGSYSGRFRWDILFSQTVSSALQSVGNRIGNIGWVVGGYHFMTPQEPHRSFKMTSAHGPAFQPDPCRLHSDWTPLLLCALISPSVK